MIDKEPILFLINSLRIGGAEKMCVQLANALFAKGINVEVMVLELKDAALRAKLNPEIKIRNLSVSHARGAFFKIKKEIQKGKYQNILVFTFQLAVILVLIRNFFKTDFKITLRSINNPTHKFHHEKSLWHKYVGGFLIRRFIFQVDQIIAQSSGMQRELEQMRSKSTTPIHRIFNFVTLPDLGENLENEEFESVDGTIELVFVGKLKKQKNVSFLIESMKEVLYKRPDVVFRIVGDGEQKRNLVSLVEELDLGDSVRFEGVSENVSVYYRRASLFLLGSLYEGFPNVLLEALSYGVPVVSVDCPNGPEDIVEEGINGFLVQGYDPRLFAETIERALSHQWDTDSIVATVAKFSSEHIVNQYINLLVGKEVGDAA